MSAPKPTIEEQLKALAWLRKGWDGDNSERAIKAFETLDNGGVFATLDDVTGYDTAPEAVCTYQVGGGYNSPPEHCELAVEDGEEYCPRHKPLADADSQLDPAEWADTTREDMARHQGFVDKDAVRSRRVDEL